MVKNILWIIMIVIIFLNADLYSQDTSCGIVWGAPVELSSSGIIPRIAVQGDTLHVTWAGSGSLPYLRSTNNGLSWDSLRDLWIYDPSRQPFQSWILANEKNVYLFWRDAYIPTNMIQTAYRKSSDKGTTWSDNQLIQLSRGSNIWDASLLDNMIALRITYHMPLGGWPFILRSTDAGQTWSVSPDSIPGYNMKLALSNGALHIIQNPYIEPYPYEAPEIEYRLSTNLGDTWEKVELISTDDGFSSMIPSIASDGKNRIFTTWRDTKYENCGSMFGCDIVGRLSTNNGVSWGTEWLFTDVPLGTNSSIDLNGKIFCVVWEEDDADENYGVNARVSLDGGNSWCLPIKIGSQGHKPQVEITDRAIHIVYWADVENSFRIYYVRGALPIINTEIPVQKNWNLISVPVNASDALKDNIYPSSVSSAFTYNKTYNTTELLNTGEGYWLKFAHAETVTVSGVPIKYLDIPVRTGWNMIGSITSPVTTSSITTEPPNIISSFYYGYKSGYRITDTIQPGKGYWIKVNQPGKLFLSSGGFGKTTKPTAQSNVLNDFNLITLIDINKQEQKLYFGNNPEGKFSIDFYEMPPLSPSGIFDARFASKSMLEVIKEGRSGEFPIQISSAEYPLTISWEMKSSSISALLKIGDEEIRMSGVGNVKIADSDLKIALKLTGSVNIPTEFALEQNYPNPFNPSTIISYQLPIESWVTLKIYNVLGQEVKTLVDELQDAGYKFVEWNSTNNFEKTVVSGVYFYKLVAGNFVLSKKMLLAR